MKNSMNFIFNFLLLFGFGITLQAQSSNVTPVNIADFNATMERNDTGDRDGPTVDPGQGSGGGSGQSAIVHNWPVETKMTMKNATIEWHTQFEEGQSVPNPRAVTIEIFDTATEFDEEIDYVYKIQTSGTSAIIPFASIHLDTEKEYTMNIYFTDDNSMGGKSIALSFADISEFNQVISMITSMQEYKRSKRKVKRQLLEATALEINGYNYDAYSKYNVFFKNDKDDVLLRNMKDEFMERVSIDKP